MNTPEFWSSTDDVSTARKLRLATITNLFNQNVFNEQEAKELLRGNLSPDDPSTYYDDSEYLGFDPAKDGTQ